HLQERSRRPPDQGCRHDDRPGWEIPPPAPICRPSGRQSGDWHGSPSNTKTGPGCQRRRGTRHGRPGPCMINGPGEGSDEAYPHGATEGPERPPGARAPLAEGPSDVASLPTVPYVARDAAAAVAWYPRLLGAEPYSSQPVQGRPAYAEFHTGDYQQA